jgi:tRNA-specific 2-thiouridylase
MKLWGGPSDSGCCSVSDVDDARRVAQQLGVVHHVFNFSEDFDAHVVQPYVGEHAAGRTPNPCVECNRHIKFDRFVQRAVQLGFDAVATGHHARVSGGPVGSCAGSGVSGGRVLRRGVDAAKDQSYVLYMLGQDVLGRLLLPIGSLTKAAVRQVATDLGLRTAAKPDSQDVCFISRTGGREAFLGSRIPFTPGTVFDRGEAVGSVPAVELVTLGQRRGFSRGPERRYVTAIVENRIELGSSEDLLVDRIRLAGLAWVDGPPAADEDLEVQTSAHGQPVPARWRPGEAPAGGEVQLGSPVRRVAPGQSVVLYRGDAVVGGGLVS